ncbi:MAG: glycosyltransferase family 4 protein [Actinomycetota bacterium]
MRRLHYLADVRLPTEKAHGWQIVKMSEAFAANGACVELWTPRRRQEDRTLRSRSAFDYYALPRTFEHRRLANVDLVSLEPHLPGPVARSAILANAAAWSASAVRRARRDGAELVYTRDLGVAYWAERARIRCVYEAHTLPGSRSRRVWRRIGRRASVVALTPFIAEEFARLGVPFSRITVEGDAVDLTPFAHLPSKEEARLRLGLPASGRLVGYVGRFHLLHQERGLPELVTAFATVARSHPDASLLAIGGPMDRVPAYREIAAAHQLDPDRVLFVDRVPNADVPMWLAALDLGVMPTTRTQHFSYAASPLKLFEYLAAGLPIVAGDLPSTRLVLRHEETALLAEPENPAALADAMSRLLSDEVLAERLGSQGRRDVQGMTWKARAERILHFAGMAEKASA